MSRATNYTYKIKVRRSHNQQLETARKAVIDPESFLPNSIPAYWQFRGIPGPHQRTANKLSENQSHNCWICGGIMIPAETPHTIDPRGLRATCDHFIPRSDGGSDEQTNLLAAHWYCNKLRRNSSPLKTKAKLRLDPLPNELKLLRQVLALPAGIKEYGEKKLRPADDDSPYSNLNSPETGYLRFFCPN